MQRRSAASVLLNVQDSDIAQRRSMALRLSSGHQVLQDQRLVVEESHLLCLSPVRRGHARGGSEIAGCAH